MKKHIKNIIFLFFLLFSFQNLQSQYGGVSITTNPDTPTVNDEVVINFSTCVTQGGIRTTSTYSISGNSICINISAYIGNLMWIECYCHKDTVGSLDAGKYVVNVTLNNFFFDMKGSWIYGGTYYYDTSFTVFNTDQCAISTEITASTNILCHGDSTGTATITPSGGTEPYSYLWDDQENTTDSIVTGLTANKYYHVTVTDSNGCTAIDSVILSEPDVLTASITDWTNILCNGDSTGTATITPSGGTKPYSYLWNDPSNTTDSIVTGLIANKYYHVTITDSNGCSYADSIILHEPPPFLIFGIIENVTCYGYADGYFSIIVQGGTPPYEYPDLWPIPPLVGPGTYIITVRDANKCTVSATIIITEPEPLVVEFINITNSSCQGCSNGSVTVQASGGEPPYYYLWDDPANTSGPFVSGLTANVYYHVTVYDEYGCSVIDSVMVNVTSEAIQKSSYNLKIYPNPFNYKTVILFENPTSEKYCIYLTNLAGKVIYFEDNLYSERIEFTRDGIPNGYYLIELRGPKIYRSKIVIE